MGLFVCLMSRLGEARCDFLSGEVVSEVRVCEEGREKGAEWSKGE